MQLADIRPLLQSPCCHAGLSLQSEEFKGHQDTLWGGTWQCEKCNKTYPQREGVAFLSVVDEDWIMTLGEIITRRRTFQREIDAAELAVDRQLQHDTQNAGALEVMGTLFDAAAAEASITPGIKLLDVGAGMAYTSAEWTKRGARVVACETEMSHLLYQSFQDIHPAVPDTVQLPGRTVPERNPQQHEVYFTRVVAPAHRLPFRDGSFDVVFCRSVLHHLHSLDAAMTEMLRVLRPGGQFIACSEPIRSVLDSEDHHLVGILDKEEGLNEQIPSLWNYFKPLKRWTTKVAVQAWPMPHQFESARLFGYIPYNYHKHLWPGETVRGWKIAKLFPISSSANIYAQRTSKPIPSRPRSTDSLPNLGMQELAAIHIPKDWKDHAQFQVNTQILSQSLRKLRSIHSQLPHAFHPGATPERELQIGWRRIVTDQNGEAYRHTNRAAMVTLLRAEASGQLRMEVTAPVAIDGMGTCAGLVKINNLEVGRFQNLGAGWQTLQFDLPPGEAGAVDVEIINTSSSRSDAEGPVTELGLGVKWILVA